MCLAESESRVQLHNQDRDKIETEDYKIFITPPLTSPIFGQLQPLTSIYGTTFIIFIVSLNSWCPLVSHFLPNIRSNVFVRMENIWIKNYLLVVLIPGCDSCDNVIMSRISEASQETSASQEVRERGISDYGSGECCPLQFLLLIKILTKHFVCRSERTNVSLCF